MEHKKYKKCGKKFEVSDDDLEFIRKVSPEYGGELLELPAPELCVTCRRIEHLIWRNERSIYKIKSDKSGQKELLSGIIKCEKTGKPFKIISQELAFYIENKIPIPTKHSETRYKQLFKLRNPRKLYHRQCMCEETGHGHEGRCPNEFETTYAPDRPEKVYCESCYQKSIL